MANQPQATLLPDSLQDHTPSILFLLAVLFFVYISNTGKLTKVVAVLKTSPEQAKANATIPTGEDPNAAYNDWAKAHNLPTLQPGQHAPLIGPIGGHGF